ILLLRFVAAYCLFDAMNLIFSGALRGAGDTRFILRVGVLMCPIPAALTWLGTEWLGMGLIFSWVVLTLWTCALGLIYLLRFLQGHWRDMRVIEPAVIDESIELEMPSPVAELESLSALARDTD
ncbi:MAG: polysaccharide biosynthesis C-terminal domain-containing protein, partial [Thermogutta sp.]|uniref:polysaccharide biosynthesis C-terminal domain-containing protein n=1 Tax=Thermogutta sp. TaxID=1962930 RepID=UPI001989816C